MSDFSCGMRMWVQVSFVLFHNHTFDGHSDGPATWKRYEIGRMFFFTERKWYTGFPLAPKSVTLNNLKRCNGCYFTLFYRIC